MKALDALFYVAVTTISIYNILIGGQGMIDYVATSFVRNKFELLLDAGMSLSGWTLMYFLLLEFSSKRIRRSC